MTILDPTTGSLDGEGYFSTRVADTLAKRLHVADGLYMAGATGGDQGAGTINATTVYDDSVDVTCMALEYLETGTFDPARWDEMVPDIVIEAQEDREPATEDVEVEVVEHIDEPDGSVTRRRRTKTERRPVLERVPVYDDDGNGIDMIERPVMQRVPNSQRVIPRRHEGAHRFKAMLDEGFDPRDPVAYLKKMRADRALPGMPSEAEWTERRKGGQKLSNGEIINRMWLAVELLAIAFDGLEKRVTKLERR